MRPSPAAGLALALALAAAPPARANMAQTRFLGETHGPLVPQASTTVRVDEEKLSFDLADDLASAEVRASYQLTSTAAAREAVEIAFAYVRGDNEERTPRASIEVDGAPVAAEITTDADLLERGLRAFLGAHPEVVRALAAGDGDASLPQLVAAAGGKCAHGCDALRAYHKDAKAGADSTWSREHHVIEAAEEATPAAAEALFRGWSKFPNRSRMGFVLFRLELDPGQRRAVTARYTHAPASDSGRRVPVTYTYDYLLSPAKRWASFGPLEIAVRAPAHAVLDPSLPLRREGEVHRASLPTLPEGELRLRVHSRRGLWFGWSDPERYWLVAGGAAGGAAIGAAAFTGRFWRSLGRWKQLLLRVLVAGPASAVAALATLGLVALPMPEHALGHAYLPALGALALAAAAVPLGAVVSFVAAAIGRRRAARG